MLWWENEGEKDVFWLLFSDHPVPERDQQIQEEKEAQRTTK